ncbi:trypsin-like peptidase domain-containing protein [Nonomuraea sp. NPDC049400]|uniref:trypsin-like peptidase domain-containing protein n=1 Tax=Nonomuraea sp. NPDC049400 TaxID=3364352 RepID=UPI0037B17D6C
MRYDDEFPEPPELYAPDESELDEAENPHPQYERIAEVIVRHMDGSAKRGSGYLVALGRVLTCAHVVSDASTIQVRFKGDTAEEWLGVATVELSDEKTDIAVLAVDYSVVDEVTPISFGLIGKKAAVLACSAVGFPRFKLRDDDVVAEHIGGPAQYRDSFHLSGSAPLLSNQKEGTLEIDVSTPLNIPLSGEASPWEGMSGAAVFAENVLIGVIARHYKTEGAQRLTAVRIDTSYQQMSRANLERLQNLIGLPSGREELTDPLSPNRRPTSSPSYLARVKNYAPENLVDRDSEIDQLISFCAGNEKYLWIQAPPWAGKTALASWFVLNPPFGTNVASFFIALRISSEASIHPFLVSMTRQLAYIANRHVRIPNDEEGRIGQFNHLISVAAQSIPKTSLLVLVIDGLDEDSGSRPSIASALPRNPPENVRIIVTGRPHPALPSDVPGQHPLRSCRRYELTPSPYATLLEIEAENELQQLLEEKSQNLEIVGYLAACQDGLTVRDLAELTRRKHFDIRKTLNTRLGRSLRVGFNDGSHDGYVFAHDTLRRSANLILDGDLDHYRRRINEWADTYKARGWPADTPRYLLSPYGRMLLDADNIERYSDLVSDAKRHDLMLAREASSAGAISEIIAFQSVADSRSLDIAVLTNVAIERARVLGQNKIVNTLHRGIMGIGSSGGKWKPPPISALQYACLLARISTLISDLDRERARTAAFEGRDAVLRAGHPVRRAAALTDVSVALARSGDWEAARSLAYDIEDLAGRSRSLRLISVLFAEHGQEELALHTTESIEPLSARLESQIEVAMAIVNESPKRALAIVDRMFEGKGESRHPLRGGVMAKGKAYVLTRSGQWERALNTAAHVDQRRFQYAIIADTASFLAHQGHIGAFDKCLHRVERLEIKDTIIADNVAALAMYDQEAYAERLIATISASEERSRGLGTLGASIVTRNVEQGRRLLGEARMLLKGMDELFQSSTARHIAKLLIREESFELAKSFIDDISDLQVRAGLTGCLGASLIDHDAELGERYVGEARNLIRGLSDLFQSPTTKEIIDALIREDRFLLAETLIGDLANHKHRVNAINSLLLGIANSLQDELEGASRDTLSESAYRLTVDALRHDYWPLLFIAFIRLYPDAFDLLLGELKNWRARL